MPPPPKLETTERTTTNTPDQSIVEVQIKALMRRAVMKGGWDAKKLAEIVKAFEVAASSLQRDLVEHTVLEALWKILCLFPVAVMFFLLTHKSSRSAIHHSAACDRHHEDTLPMGRAEATICTALK